MALYGVDGFRHQLGRKLHIFGIGGSGGGLKITGDELGSRAQSAGHNLLNDPARFGENFFMSSNPVGLSLGQFDKWTGGTGSFRSSMGNPYVQTGAGVAASFAGVPWYAGMGLGGGMGALSGGNTQDVMQGAQYGGLGQAGGNIAQLGYSGLGSSSSTGGVAPGSQVYGGEPIGGGVPVSGPPTPEGVYPTFSPDAAGAERQLAEFGPTAARTAGSASGGGGLGGIGGGLGGGGGGISSNQMMGMMGIKTGLGYLSNMQAQAALEPELEERRRAMERIRRLQENPALAYQNDPALSAMRSRALGATGARYRARFGGGEGGALARDLYRTGAASDRAALNQALSGEYQMLGATQPAVGQNQAAGGTSLGAFTGPASGAMTDYALLQFLGAI